MDARTSQPAHQTHQPPHGLAARTLRPRRAGAARRRRARRLSGRRLSGAARGRHRAGLGLRRLDRRDQLGDHRRQSAGAAARAAAASSGSASPTARSGTTRRTATSSARRATLTSSWMTIDAGPARLLHAALRPIRGSASPARRPRPAITTPRRSSETLLELVDFDLINEKRSASRSAPSTCSPATSSISTTPRTRSSRSTSWRAARCRRRCRWSRSAPIISGTAASSPTRRCSICSTRTTASTRWSSRSTCSARAACCRATSRT